MKAYLLTLLMKSQEIDGVQNSILSTRKILTTVLILKVWYKLIRIQDKTKMAIKVSKTSISITFRPTFETETFG